MGRARQRILGIGSRAIVAAIGALVYALFGIRILSSSFVSVLIAVRDYASTASGGIGSAGGAVDVFFVPYALLALGSIVANRMLAAWARGSSREIKALYKTQRWSIVLAFVVAISSVAGFTAGGQMPLPLVLLPLSGVMWGLQFVLTGILLGTYALRTARTRNL
jgi:hypothetical protein